MYDGDFFKNVREGNGILKFSNGDIYEGEFKGNRMHGKGKYYWTTGDNFEGIFENGKIKKGDCNFSIGVKGSGIFDENKLDFELIEVPPQLSTIEEL